MLPVLEEAACGEVTIPTVAEKIAKRFGLSEEEKQKLIPSGKQTVLSNRTHWAKSYLSHALLVQKTKYAHFTITPRGKDVLAAKPQKVDIQFLSKFPEFVAFRSKAVSHAETSLANPNTVSEITGTPDELLRQTAQQLNDEVREDLLERLLSSKPVFFENAVVSLLLAMGYGGSREGAGRAIGKVGDGGLDGVIDEDALGLDRVYIQAKRYKSENKIGAPELQAFHGAIAAVKATKGVFVTTSDFTAAAKQFAEKVHVNLVLINGDELTRLMARYNVGVRIHDTVYVKKIDEDFFSED